MTREAALKLVLEKVKTKNLVKHMLAAEAVMRKLGAIMNEDEDKWAMAGLLHDIDYEDTKDHPEIHSKVGAELLASLGMDPEIVYAVKVHNGVHGFPRKSLMDKALYAVDPLTGLIVAAALIHPAKKIHVIDGAFVLNRFNEKHFAKGANREAIKSCVEFDMSLEAFIAAGVDAMQEVAADIGL